MPDPLLAEKQALAANLSNAEVREIPYQTAKKFIVEHEWLGNVGTTEVSFGLYFGEHLAGGRVLWQDGRDEECRLGLRSRVCRLCQDSLPWSGSALGAPALGVVSHRPCLSPDE
jgi:hypothetical protein